MGTKTKAAKPTARQKRLIDHHFKIPPLKSKADCSRLITYILQSSTSDEEIVERIREVRRHVVRWTGATVKIKNQASRYHDQMGKVISLGIRSLRQMAIIAAKAYSDPYPVVAKVKVDSNTEIQFSLSDLKIIVRPRQKLLFSLVKGVRR